MTSTLRRTVLVIALAIAGGAGCAHPGGEIGAARDTRGAVQLAAGQPRLLVAGPAPRFHAATEDRSVSLFLARLVNGDDRDCAQVHEPVSTAASAARQLQVPERHVLCAVAPPSTRWYGGRAELLWHAHRGHGTAALALH
jgi:hypothetical protein